MKLKNRIKKAFSQNSRDETLLSRGIPGSAEVLDVKKSAVKTESTRGSSSIYKYKLRVTIAGREQYEASHSENRQAQAGATVAVKVDPDDPENLLIDWSAS